jgi:hypothetical protein
MEDDLQWKTTINGRQPQMEDNLQWKTTSNLQWMTTSNGRRPPMEDDLKILKATTVWVVAYEFLGGKLEGSSEEISSVALLSPTCFLNRNGLGIKLTFTEGKIWSCSFCY